DFRVGDIGRILHRTVRKLYALLHPPRHVAEAPLAALLIHEAQKFAGIVLPGEDPPLVLAGLARLDGDVLFIDEPARHGSVHHLQLIVRRGDEHDRIEHAGKDILSLSDLRIARHPTEAW